MQSEITRYVYSLMNRLSRVGRKQFSNEDTCADPAMMAMIFCPGEDGCARKIRMTDISRQLMISKPAATQAIGRLVELELVERIRDEADRRVVYIQTTKKGLELFESKLNERLSILEQAIDRVGLEKVQQLGALLDEFVDALVSVSEV